MSAVFGKSAELVVSGEPGETAELGEPADADAGEPAELGEPPEAGETAETAVSVGQLEQPAWYVLLFSFPSVSVPPPCCP